jgi:hypothetical protein
MKKFLIRGGLALVVVIVLRAILLPAPAPVTGGTTNYATTSPCPPAYYSTGTGWCSPVFPCPPGYYSAGTGWCKYHSTSLY